MNQAAEAEAELVFTLIDSCQFDEAFRRGLPLAVAGSTSAQMAVGWMYQCGKGVGRNFDQAESWYRRVAETGSPVGEYYVGTVFGQRGQWSHAFEWFERAAAQDFLPAIYKVGKSYRRGLGVPTDPAKGLALIRAAADRGHLFARRDVARLKLAGRLGLLQIPAGLIEFLRVLKDGVRVGLTGAEQ